MHWVWVWGDEGFKVAGCVIGERMVIQRDYGEVRTGKMAPPKGGAFKESKHIGGESVGDRWEGYG